jgi:hypothetical protein
MKRVLIALLVCCSGMAAADFQQVKLLDVAPYKSPQLIAGATPILVEHNMFTLTVAIGDLSYSASYYAQRHVKSSDFIVGDSIPAKIEGDKLVIKSADGKEMKARITRRERLTPESKP